MRRPDMVVLGGAIVAALLLRIHCLFVPYLWLDEYVTLWSIGGATYGEMLSRATRWTASGPIFVLLYRASCDLAGDVELGLKLPGIVLGTFAVWLAWWTTRALFDRRDASLAAAWLVALSPLCIHFSQDGRPYMPTATCLVGSLGLVAQWLRTGNRWRLAGSMALVLIAVGIHLLAALALVAYNLAVLVEGCTSRWPRRRWIDWVTSQVVVACGLWFVGVQFRALSGRHGSMILETNLPMLTRATLDGTIRSESQLVIGFVLAAIGLAWAARRFPATTLGSVWREHRTGVIAAAAAFVAPSLALTGLSALRIIDPWIRYYFLFELPLTIALAWLASCAFPRVLSRCLLALLLASSVNHFNFVNGVLSCRLNGVWRDCDEVLDQIRQRIQPGDLVLSRGGLVEANSIDFLRDPVGSSYLKCFGEAKDGPLPAEHISLPFSPEKPETREYIDRLVATRLTSGGCFWVLNLGCGDFDYNEWLVQQFPGRFRRVAEWHHPAASLCRWVCEPRPEETVAKK